MSGAIEPLALASGFPPVTLEDWRRAADKALRGADFERTLVSRTLDGIRIEPLYTGVDVATAEDEAGFPGLPPLLRGGDVLWGTDSGWDVRARVEHPDPAEANTRALIDLRGGATSLDVVVDADGSGRGVSCRSASDLGRVLTGVLFGAAGVCLRAGAHADVAAGWLVDLWQEHDFDRSQATGCLGLDPLGSLAERGSLPVLPADAVAAAAERARQIVEVAPQVRTMRASGVTVFDGGASEGQEIGFVLAAGAAYLRALVAAGLPVRLAARQITLEVAADVDLFSTIAKIRALRHCWSTILAASGVRSEDAGPAATRVEAVAGGRWVTDVDPWVNLLRGTSAAAGAAIGGADAILVVPFDSARGAAGDLGHRLARNTQLLLHSEASLGRVMDPAGGSYYVESLTDDLAEVGWTTLQRYEAAGGLAAAVVSGLVADEVERVAAVRAELVASRRYPITGVSEFPLLGERRPSSAPVPDDSIEASSGAPTAGARPIRAQRLAAPFERLRAAAEPLGLAVFSANIGGGSDHIARASFAANLFAAGGIATTGDGGHVDAGDMVRDFTRSGAVAAVICGTDDAYAEHAVGFARALRGAGARHVVLAGRPGDLEEELRAAGVDDFVFAGCDALAAIGRLHEALGVRS